ncbi:MAG: ATP-dependent DNA ligase [Propionibacteriales bacterium]|nr:ATP-dependent DNA ligase [Propionibacteriales bacterium]
MDLPVNPPVSPMLARSVKAVPPPEKTEGGFLYEPKWDGFRCIAFRDGDEVELGSRNERPLNRYFPEVVAAVGRSLPHRCVIDGEIVVAQNGRLEFERLLERIHPAKSRVDMLAEKTPALLVAFDILALDDESLIDQPLERRREALESAMSAAAPPIHLTQATRDHATAQEWLGQFEGAGLDGVIAKPMTSIYEPAARGSWYKIKHDRTADVVVAGYRLHKKSTPAKPLLGSLLLGLYDDAGTLQHIGVSAAFAAARRAELLDELRPLEIEAADHPWGAWAEGAEGDRRPGAVSRWNAGKDLSWTPLDPVLVCEVGYDHMEGTRFRHTAQFKHWRPDRDPRSCTYEQLEEVAKYDLDEVLT